MEEFNFDTEVLLNFVFEYGPAVLKAIAVLVFGLWAVKGVIAVVKRIFERSEVAPSLAGFLKSIISLFLKVLVYITALGMLGIQMTSFIAILGAAGLAVGLALQGSLSNFAGGVLILFFKPFKVGDFIVYNSDFGTVEKVDILYTTLATPNNETIIIPNGDLANSPIENHSKKETRRIDATFGIAYGDDVDKAYKVLRKIVSEDERILTEPEPFLAVKELGDSSVNIALRVWTNTPDHWPVKFSLNEKVYKTFDKEGLSIPFPQRDVHLHQVN